MIKKAKKKGWLFISWYFDLQLYEFVTILFLHLNVTLPQWLIAFYFLFIIFIIFLWQQVRQGEVDSILLLIITVLWKMCGSYQALFYLQLLANCDYCVIKHEAIVFVKKLFIFRHHLIWLYGILYVFLCFWQHCNSTNWLDIYCVTYRHAEMYLGGKSL